MGNAQVDRVKSYLQGEFTYLELDEELGWRIRKSGHNELYRANSAGIRASREYALRAPPNILRIQAFGDSFTHCDDVANDASWQAIMERTYANLEVMNFGVPAYGLDQAYLRYLNNGRRYQPDIVLIGFMTENFFRTVNTYRPFLYLRALPFSKPRYEIKQARLALIPSRLKTPDDFRALLLNPHEVLSAMVISDYFYKIGYESGAIDWSPAVRLSKIFNREIKKRTGPRSMLKDGRYNKHSEAFEITQKIFDVFYAAAQTNGSVPVILIFPNKEDINRFRKFGIKSYTPLLTYFESRDYRYIDFMEVFETRGQRYDVGELFGAIHYSALANILVATHVYDYVARNRAELLEPMEAE